LGHLISGLGSRARPGNPFHKVGENVGRTLDRALGKLREGKMRAESHSRQGGNDHQHHTAVRDGLPGDLNSGSAGH
jgi:hypothetical protein